MLRSVALLGAEGEKEWDLPVWWLKDGENDSDEDSDDEEKCSDEDNSEDGEKFESGIDGGVPGEGGGGGGPGDGDSDGELDGSGGDGFDLESKIGHFALFLAESCPVLVGKVVAVREVEGRKDIQVHWYTPVNNTLRSNATSVPFAAYCNTRVAYAGDFVFEDASSGGRRKRVPDQDWESVDRVVVWSKRKQLNGDGNKLPKCAVDAVSKAYQRRHAEEGEEGGGGG